MDGILLAHPCLARLEGLTVLLRRDFAEVKSRQVTLISGAPRAGGRPHRPARPDRPADTALRDCARAGGGSGHEPAQAGYIGEGMLTVRALLLRVSACGGGGRSVTHDRD